MTQDAGVGVRIPSLMSCVWYQTFSNMPRSLRDIPRPRWRQNPVQDPVSPILPIPSPLGADKGAAWCAPADARNEGEDGRQPHALRSPCPTADDAADAPPAPRPLGHAAADRRSSCPPRRGGGGGRGPAQEPAYRQGHEALQGEIEGQRLRRPLRHGQEQVQEEGHLCLPCQANGRCHACDVTCDTADHVCDETALQRALDTGSTIIPRHR